MTNQTIKCHLLCSSTSDQLTPIFTGFNMLHASEKIKMTAERDQPFTSGVNDANFLKVVINDTIHIAYDTDDSKTINEALFQWSHFYFKRSYLYSSEAAFAKIYPLGLTYLVFSDKDYLALKRLIWNVQKGASINTLLPFLRSSYVMSWLLKMQKGKFTSNVAIYEDYPSLTKPLKIVFVTRLWGPTREQDEEGRIRLNKMRVDCVRALKKQFGDQFWGGLYPSDDARQQFGDMVLSKKEIYKYRYLQQLKNSQIGIATQGLLGSNGWKLAEYTASSMAIVSEALQYGVPGGFLPGKNYLEFSSPDECVEKVQHLIDEPELRYSLMKNNFDYYHTYVRPDALVWNTIQMALLKSRV